jgi:hypothetical protein
MPKLVGLYSEYFGPINNKPIHIIEMNIEDDSISLENKDKHYQFAIEKLNLSNNTPIVRRGFWIKN